MIQQTPYRPRRAAAPHLAWLLLGAAACGGGPKPPTIVRTLDGQTRPSPFVPPTAYEAYIRGELALTEGKYDEAMAQLELATTAPDEDAFLLSRLAYAQALAGFEQEASATLAHADRVDPCSEAVWLTRGELHERAGSLREAASAYARAGECAPRSPRGPIAQARVLEQAGERSAAVEVLSTFASRGDLRSAQAAFELALRAEDTPALAHALETWIAYEAPDEASLERAIRWALEQGEPRLALRLREHHLSPLPPALEAELLLALGDREGLSRLLGRTPASDLGGPERTAELSLAAGDDDRAELEATSALLQGPSDAMYGVRAQARLKLGRYPDALEDLAAIRDANTRRQTVTALLGWSGLPALAEELKARGLELQ